MNDRPTPPKIDLIMFCQSTYREWQDGLNNRHYQLLKNLLESGRVGKILMVDYLPHNFLSAMKTYKENFLFNLDQAEIVQKTILSKLSKINDKLYVYSTVKNRFSPAGVIKDLREILKKLNFNNLVSWSGYPLWIDYFHAFDEKLTIFDAVDNWAELSDFVKIKEKIIDNYQKISQNADLIFAVSEEAQKIFPNRQKIIWLPNGVDFSHFQKSYNLINRDIGDLKKPIIGYVGTFEKKVDVALLKKIAAKTHQQATLFLLGPNWSNKFFKSMAIYENVVILNYKNYDELPMYLQQFDLGIVPYKNDLFGQSTNPLKIYEYLAVGKPVVATYDKDLEIFLPYIYLAKTNDEFLSLIEKALTEDSQILREKRKQLVKEQTWKKRTNTMLDYIYKKLGF